MNICCFAGNLTKTPELRTTQSGKKVTSFSIAVNEGKDKTEFINCQAWEKTAELVCQYSKKGDRLSLSGRLQTTKYTDSNGIEKYKTEVVVNQFDFPPKTKEAPQECAPATHDDDEIPF